MYSLIGEGFINMMKSINPNTKVASGKTEVAVRCIFCGDSKMKNHAHLYISVPNTESDMSMYHCKLCGAHGLVTDEFLRKIGCYDANILVEVAKHTAEVLALPKYKTLKKIDIYPLSWNYIREDVNNNAKLQYINNRIGSDLSISDLAKLKIFLNLYDVINYNRLELTRDKRICDSLDKFFIGFISYDNSYCTMRNLSTQPLYKSIDKRYIKYNLVNKIEDSKNYYIIPTQIDVTSFDPINIYIAEGTFDILSIYYNLNHQNDYQCIYIACGGKSYKQALEFVLSEIGVINYIVHWFPDKDVLGKEFQYTMNSVMNLPCEMYIHVNTYDGQKDYGVPMDKIEDSIQKISLY